MNYISEHAKKRFKERYDFELPNNFVDYLIVNGIKQNVINKNGQVMNNKNRGIYRAIFGNHLIEYVLTNQRNGDNVISTFNTPPKTMNDTCYSYKGNSK